jgi:hypothetical protein
VADKKPDLASALARAEKLSPVLAHVTDNLNTQIWSFAEKLTNLKLGVPGFASMDSDAQENWERFLTFRKDGKEWGLFVGEGDLAEVHTTYTPLTNASRDTRLRAVDLFPALVEDMISRAEKEIENVQTKADKVASFIAQLSKEG